MSTREVVLAHGTFELDERGEGSPLVYLHGMWDEARNPLLEALASRYHVLAPAGPGFGGTKGEEHLRSVGDAVIFYLDLLDALGLEEVMLVGHCLGGMFAAELAAVQPQRFSSVVLIAPYGLWDDSEPGIDPFVATPGELAAALYGVRPPREHRALLGPEPLDFEGLNDEEVVELRLARARGLSGSARFLWPIPDRGLASRSHRLPARTLVLLGGEDLICPPGPFGALSEMNPGVVSEVLPGAGHLVHYCAPEAVLVRVQSFLEQ